MKSKFIPVALIVVFLILIMPLVSSAGQETQLSWNTGETGLPTIYGDKVVWSNWNEIHLCDLKTGKYTTISMPANRYAVNPAIYGNEIVYPLYNWDNGNNDGLRVYDIPTSASSLITENVAGWTPPDIYGDRIVWASEYNIYMRDISTHIQTQITTSGSASFPAIYGNKIVWMDNGRSGTVIDENGNSYSRSDIYMYDISAKKETRITTSGLASNPAIYNNRIVWQDCRNSDYFGGYGDIYMYDISTRKEIRISYSRQSSSPAIYDKRIVWQDEQNGYNNIYMYDLSTEKKTQITTSGCALSPVIYGNIIVYGDYRNAPSGDMYCNVYMYDLAAKPIKPTATITADKTSGISPLSIQFTSITSGNPNSYYWNFGDGVDSKHAVTATHTYTKAGTYTVSLKVTNSASSTTATNTNYITVTAPVTKPVAAFTTDKTSGKKSLTVTFKYTGTGSPDTYYWNFGDGVDSKHAVTATHTFTKAGTYTVSLKVTNSAGSNTATKSKYITVK